MGSPPLRSALRSAAGRVGRQPRSPSLAVLCSGGSGGSSGGGPGGRLTPDQHRRALSVLSNTRLLNWKEWGSSLGGTLVVDDSSHKEQVQKVRRGSGQASWQEARGGCRVLC